MSEFNLRDQWKLFLKTAKLDEQLLSPVQLQETRRAFYAGMGQMLLLMRDEVSKFEEDEGVKILEDFLNQIGKFWLNESHRQN